MTVTASKTPAEDLLEGGHGEPAEAQEIPRSPGGDRGPGIGRHRQDAITGHRRYAVEALWRHAADLQFTDPASTEALRRLASDGNETVRALAARPVLDMDRYLRSAQPSTRADRARGES